MNTTLKRSLQLIFVIGLLLLFTPQFQANIPAQAASANAQANSTQAILDQFTYLPVIAAPVGPIFLPLIYAPAPEPQWGGPFGGSAEIIVADPNQADIFYAGTVGNGIYKSTDGGVSWTWSGSGLGNLWTDSLAIDPRASNILYAGTHGNGVYKSSDWGQNWYPVNQGILDGAVVYSLAVNPGNNNLVYAGVRSQGILSGGETHYQGVLYKSSNGGASWSPVLNTYDDWVYSIAVNPKQPNILLAAVHQTGPFIAQNYGGSGDWQLASISGGEWAKGRVVAFDPREGNSRAYYATWHGDFYISSNNGSQWGNVSNSGLGAAHIYPNGIAINPSDPTTLYLAAHDSSPAGVMKSTNAGSYWNPSGLAGKTMYSVAVSSGNNDIVLAGTYLDGIFRSTNGGKDWARSTVGLSNVQVTGVAVSGASTILSGILGSGAQLSTDGGATWTDFNNNIGDGAINRLVLNPANTNVVFALTNSAGLRRIDLSMDSRWSAVLDGAAVSSLSVGSSNTRQPSPFARHEPLDEVLALEGETAAVPQVGPNNSALPASTSLLDIAFAPSDPNIVYLGTAGAGLYASTNNGAVWTQVGLAGNTLRSIAVDSRDPNLVYAVTGQAGVVKVSSDGGKHWADIALPGLTANVLAVPHDRSGGLYAGTDNGMWMYDGQQWQQAGLQGVNVTQLASDPTRPERVYAGTPTGAYIVVPSQNTQTLLPETVGVAIQTIDINPIRPEQVYFGTVYRGTVRYIFN